MKNYKSKNKPILFSANIGFLYNEMPFLERIEAAAIDGFDGIECHWPYDIPNKKIQSILQQTDMPLIGINTHPGNLKKGFFGLTAIPGYQEKARIAIRQAINYGSILNLKNLHVMAGNAGKTKAAKKTFCENLNYACELAYKHKITVLIEPLNSRDHQNYYLSTLRQAIEIIFELNLPNLKIMFDYYHINYMKENAISLFKENKELIGHIQIASIPNREEPSSNEFEFLRFISKKYNPEKPLWVGAEYKPKTGFVRDGISWLSILK